MPETASSPNDVPEAAIEALLALQRRASLAEGSPDPGVRRDRLQRLRQSLIARASDLVAAIDRDFGHRAEIESRLYDIGSVVGTIDYLERNLRRWMRPSRRRVAPHFLPARARVEYQPVGVVGVVSPWNYPVALALNPVAEALAAGNRAMLKPSEKTPATSRVLRELIEAAFAADEAAVIEGGEATARRFASLRFDHLIFTGSTAVGRSILESAAQGLVPVTLELGGKSPAVLLPDCRLERAAARIAFGKLANGGQTCIAPDYALVPRSRVEAFVAAFGRAARDLYPSFATNADMTSIATDAHFARLTRMVSDAVGSGAAPDYPLGTTASEVHARIMPPVVLTGVTAGMQVMQEEIFGPVLPVLPYDSIEDAIERINSGPRPLALYPFGARSAARRRLLARTTSGTVAINDTILQYAQDDLPFGGIGASGMGRYRGREGFETLSNVRPVFEQSRLAATRLARPPFGRAARLVARWLGR